MGSYTTERPKPRIYVACLAAYNNGILHGVWIDADQEAAMIYDEINRMLATSPIPHAEEAAIHDYEGFEGFDLEEFAGVDRASAIAGFVVKHGRLGAALLTLCGGDSWEARAAMEDRYLGCFESLADYVQELWEECMTIPEAIRPYINWQAIARDAEMGGDITVIETGWNEVHVFSGA